LHVSLIQCPVAHETVLRSAGKNCYLHVFSTAKASAFFIQKKEEDWQCKRWGYSQSLTERLSITLLTSDREHALCNSHPLRELQSIVESTGHSWATKMQQLLKTIKKEKDTGRLCYKTVQDHTKEYDDILVLGCSKNKELRIFVLVQKKFASSID
jgi:hypothetical protein